MRVGVSVGLRFRVLERDDFACRYCGSRPPWVRLVVDHVIPVAGGGTNDFENLAAACEPCNAGKSDRELTTWREVNGFRWARRNHGIAILQAESAGLQLDRSKWGLALRVLSKENPWVVTGHCSDGAPGDVVHTLELEWMSHA